MPAKKKKETETADPFAQFDAQPAFDSGESEVGVIDLTEVSDEIEYEVLPTGIYDGVIENVEYKISSKGNPMLTWTVDIREGGKAFYHTTLVDNGLVRTKKTISNLLPFAPGREYFDPKKFDPTKVKEVFVGTECRARLSVEPYQGSPRNSTKELLPPSADAEDSFVS